MSASPLRLLLAGATGAVGREVPQAALADNRIALITALTRKPLPAHPKLESIIADFSQLPAGAPRRHADAVICTLGTIPTATGSEAAFAKLGRNWAIAIARHAHAAGATRYALNASLGASLAGNFDLRTKAEAEAGVHAAGHASFTVLRPSIIDVERTESRPGEAIGLAVARLLRTMIPRRYRAVAPRYIARALLDGVLSGHAAERVIES